MYLLKYYFKSKYFGFNRVDYIEFELYSDLEYFIYHNNIIKYDVYKMIGRCD